MPTPDRSMLDVLSDGREVDGGRRTEFAVVAAVDVDLDDNRPLAGAKNLGDGARRPVPFLDGAQIADEEIGGRDGVAEGRTARGELAGRHIGHRRNEAALKATRGVR